MNVMLILCAVFVATVGIPASFSQQSISWLWFSFILFISLWGYVLRNGQRVFIIEQYLKRTNFSCDSRLACGYMSRIRPYKISRQSTTNDKRNKPDDRSNWEYAYSSRKTRTGDGNSFFFVYSCVKIMVLGSGLVQNTL